MNLDDYLKNPCGTLSIPYWKSKKNQMPLNIEIFHRDCFEDGRIIMPKLHESIYLQDEPKQDFSSNEIEMNIKLYKKNYHKHRMFNLM